MERGQWTVEVKDAGILNKKHKGVQDMQRYTEADDLLLVSVQSDIQSYFLWQY